MSRLFVAFFAGLVFAIGLGVSGMTDPNKVIAFLDVSGNWDPSLAFVMAGAMVPNIFLFRFILKRDKPALDTSFHVPAAKTIDAKLLIGAALFGVGWGMSGYCPGPAVVSIVGGGSLALLFVATMIAGTFLHRIVFTSLLKPSSDTSTTPSAEPASMPRASNA
jgi:uncharacterized membrane protein YedE/YeeE